MSKTKRQKATVLAMLCVIALISIFVVSKFATNPKSYIATMESIDEKKNTVMGLTTSAALVSTTLAAIPGDATTPIANQIMEISAYLLIVVCVLVLEKSLLTVMGYLSFNILIPGACALFAVYTLFGNKNFKAWAIKFVVFALILVTIIPFSLKISDLIYDVNKQNIEQLSAEVEENNDHSSQEEQGWLNRVLSRIKEGVVDVGEEAKSLLNNFIDAIALFIITYCAIPVLVVILMLWFVKFLFGITVPGSSKNGFLDFGKQVKNKQEIDPQQE